MHHIGFITIRKVSYARTVEVSAERNTMELYGNMVMQTAMSSITVSHFTDILFYSSDGQTVKRFLRFNF